MSCSDEIKITSKNNTEGCHMCPGYIIIEKGKTVDTLKTGSWGSPSPYEQFKYHEEDFLLIKSDYAGGGMNESSLRIISLNDGDYLQVVFDTLISDEKINQLSTRRKVMEFKAPDTLIITQHMESYNNLDEEVEIKHIDKQTINLGDHL